MEEVETVLYAARSHIGLVRPMNEDSYAVHEYRPWTLLVVADGMGGASAGEVASRMAASAVSEDILENLQQADPADVDLETVLRHAVQRANGEIWEAARQNVDLLGMGTTLVAALLHPSQLFLAHIGDSRAYRLHDGRLEQLTRDHSLVAELVRRGQITEAEAEHHPQRNIVTRSLGTAPVSEPDVERIAWWTDDLLLLCTDGLTNLVPTRELEAHLGSIAQSQRGWTEEVLGEAADLLLGLALERGGQDNITLVLAACGKEISGS